MHEKKNQNLLCHISQITICPLFVASEPYLKKKRVIYYFSRPEVNVKVHGVEASQIII